MSIAEVDVGERVRIGGLRIARGLRDFVEREVLPGTGVDPGRFWAGTERIVDDLAPRNRELLLRRAQLQHALDAWHAGHRGADVDAAAYRAYLTEIGYLEPPPRPFTVDTANTDIEITTAPGPQLLVPVADRDFAREGVDARWGSLYRALRDTDAIPPDGPGERSLAVIAYARGVLDAAAPLVTGSHASSTGYRIAGGRLRVHLADGTITTLADTARLAGFRGDPPRPSAVLIEHHGLHIDIRIDPSGPFGRIDTAGIDDVILESGLSTIMDFEDCVAAVDVPDKVEVYRSWLELMRGSVAGVATAPDRLYTAPDGSALTLHGRALLFARIVGPLMTTDAILDARGAEVPEIILDAVIATLAALHDLRGGGTRSNSRAGAVYLAVPKQHGPAEFAFTDELFGRVEALLGLPEHTVKLGLLDEERRTTVNLAACLAAVRHRVVATGNGLLDRGADEIHTWMAAGPMPGRVAMREQRWARAYEQWHVDTCLAHGLPGRALIGLGMWPTPERMRGLLETKIDQLRQGAAMTWVPTAIAATLHAVHFHYMDVVVRQQEIAAAGPRRSLGELLHPPIAEPPPAAARRAELDATCYTVLSYVVRWIERAVASSPIPDFGGVVVLEDRATLRISTQLLANWLRHNVIGEADVLDSLRRVAGRVDERLRDEPGYRPLLPEPESTLAWRAACELIERGVDAPNGYTEPVLYRWRREYKAGTV